MTTTTTRPTGVTILAILEALVGLLMILGGFALMAVGALVGTGAADAGLGVLGAFAGIMGVLLLLLGLLAFVVAWGLWTAKPWAWTLALVLAVVGVLLNLPTLMSSPVSAILPILINVVIIYYLTRPGVKTYFGKPAGAAVV